MVTQQQVDKLNQELARYDLPLNPLVRLMVASENANLALDQVLEHLIIQLLQSGRDSVSFSNSSPYPNLEKGR
jgi:hypothetical protein